jgi:hypothetical protein
MHHVRVPTYSSGGRPCYLPIRNASASCWWRSYFSATELPLVTRWRFYWINGAVGENRTHDLSLTKGLRYHYATTANMVSGGLGAEPLTTNCAKGTLL